MNDRWMLPLPKTFSSPQLEDTHSLLRRPRTEADSVSSSIGGMLWSLHFRFAWDRNGELVLGCWENAKSSSCYCWVSRTESVELGWNLKNLRILSLVHGGGFSPVPVERFGSPLADCYVNLVYRMTLQDAHNRVHDF